MSTSRGSTSTVTIRRAGGSDASLARQALVELHGRRLVEEASLAAFLADPNRHLFLAVENERVVGSLSGYTLRPPHRRQPQLLLYEIDVRPECWNRGIGKALVEKYVSEARAAGASEVWVLTGASNAAAMAMYIACGFRREHEDDVMLNLILDQTPPGNSA